MSDHPASQKPKPGSDEALDAGCLCPVLDNNHGRFAPWPPDGWYIAIECELHHPSSSGVRV